MSKERKVITKTTKEPLLPLAQICKGPDSDRPPSRTDHRTIKPRTAYDPRDNKGYHAITRR